MNGVSGSQPHVSDASTRVVVYRLYLSLVSNMLETLKNGFVSDAVSFVGVHQQRMHQVFSNYSVGKSTGLQNFTVN